MAMGEDKELRDEMVIGHGIVSHELLDEVLNFGERCDRTEMNFVGMVAGQRALRYNKLDSVHPIRVVHARADEGVPLFERSPGSFHILFAEESLALRMIGLLHAISPDDVCCAVEDAVEVEASLVQAEGP